ncbi:MFS transporter [Paenarthrobacter sp. Z7-10]|uniref:MFS transporter n=1 Tax=Paenarthrobacter sp. Z7-10 TaxID=2787635 RepID=UPI0022A9539F|nr:MFS transporter [Paenarthrobacter sp. Z7-10]MCZ2404138.1 MFS transporter [Paenarthrobacter sp. Z7-10]
MKSSLQPRRGSSSPARQRPAAFERYHALPRLSGQGFLPLGFFARLPLAMLTVGILTLVSTVSHSYAIGGLAAGAVGLGSATGAPIIGYLADRLGQKNVLLASAGTNTVALVAVVVLCYLASGFDPGTVIWVLVLSFGSGLTSPQVGPLARVRWMFLTRQLPRDDQEATLDTALSYESTADELTFVLGPALVGILASFIAPWLPLVLAAALTLTLVSLFAVHRTQEAIPRHAPTETGTPTEGGTPAVITGGLHWFRVAVPVLGMVSMGTFFGATQTALIAFTGSFGSPELGGLLYAVVGLSSSVAALSVAYWPARFAHPLRWLSAAALMAALSGLLLLPSSVPAMIVVLLALGIPVGPVMVTIFSIGGIVAPRRRLGTVMTALASGIVAGTALGSSIAGTLAQSSGYAAAFLVSMAAAVALLLLGVLTVVQMRQPS